MPAEQLSNASLSFYKATAQGFVSEWRSTPIQTHTDATDPVYLILVMEQVMVHVSGPVPNDSHVMSGSKPLKAPANPQLIKLEWSLALPISESV